MTEIGGKNRPPVYYGSSRGKDVAASLERSRAYALTALYSSLKDKFLSSDSVISTDKYHRTTRRSGIRGVYQAELTEPDMYSSMGELHLTVGPEDGTHYSVTLTRMAHPQGRGSVSDGQKPTFYRTKLVDGRNVTESITPQMFGIGIQESYEHAKKRMPALPSLDFGNITYTLGEVQRNFDYSDVDIPEPAPGAQTSAQESPLQRLKNRVKEELPPRIRQRIGPK